MQPQQGPWALLAADTDRTQDFVFESSRLPEIRGASQMLDDLNLETGEWVKAAGQLVYASGGGLLGLVPLDQAAQLVERIQRAYASRSQAATITAAFRPVEAAMLEKGYPAGDPAPFGSLMAWAATWLRREKDGRAAVPWVETLPFMERCSSCHLRPASVQASLTERALCPVCSAKAGYAAQFSWFKAYEKHLGGRPSGKVYEPHDLGEIGQCCRARPGYLGFIYLDGDRMGEVFKAVDTWQTASNLSRVIRETAELAVFQALEAHLPPELVAPSPGRQGTRDQLPPGALQDGQARIYPFEIITIGGDDIVLIVPADRAIPIACQVSQGFQEGLRQALHNGSFPAAVRQHDYTLSGGVVLAESHNPVRALRDLAGELKSSAKRMRSRKGLHEGCLDFLALMGSELPDRRLEKSRQLYPYLIEQDGFPPLSLVGRPYPARRLAEAWEALARMHQNNFPKSQVSQLAGALERGAQESGLFYQYQRQRSRQQTEGYRLLDQAILALQGQPPGAAPQLWLAPDPPGRVSAYTVLFDLAELYSLVG